MSSSRQLELAIEAEQEALWWARTATSNSSLLLYIIQTFPNRIRNSVLVPGQTLFPHSSNEGRNPLRWAREECAFNQAALEKLRDERAEHLGALVLQLQTVSSTESVSISNHRRPSHITILWPKILLKTLVIYSSFSALKYGYDQRFVIREWLSEGREAVRGLVQGWVVEPVLDVWNTVRASDITREGLVHRQGVLADIESLERMALSLAKDVLKYDDAQLQILREQVHQGDLTPLMQLYESDIRSPVKSALAGTLVRGILVQVQKAKVDIDQALTGIDKLLKSQELTFAFVGVAPALVILYVLSQASLSLGRAALFASKNALLGARSGVRETGSLISRILRVFRIRAFVCDDEEALNLAEASNGGGVGDTLAAIFGEQIPGPQTSIHGRIGKVSKRQAWADLRRVERLLIHRGVQAPTQRDEKTLEGQTRGGDALGPLATGLLLLSVVRLQAFGMSLPSSTSTTSSFSIPTAYPTSSGYLPHVVGLLHTNATSPTFGAAASSLTSTSTSKHSATHAGLLTLDTRTSFLEDVKDLGDLRLGREDKLKVVQRMWRWWDFGLDGGL